MLVVARWVHERVRIGEDVTIAVLEVDGDRVILGINAPKSVGVYREEIYKRIELERHAAGSPTESVETPKS